MSKSLSYFKAETFCLLHFVFKIFFHFASKTCYILRQKLVTFCLKKLLHFVPKVVTFRVNLHFTSKVVTFRVNVTFPSIVTFCGITVATVWSLANHRIPCI